MKVRPVIVGRGAAHYLHDCENAFHTFVYAPFDDKVQRFESEGRSQAEAMELVENVDSDRTMFIKEHFGIERPARPFSPDGEFDDRRGDGDRHHSVRPGGREKRKTSGNILLIKPRGLPRFRRRFRRMFGGLVQTQSGGELKDCKIRPTSSTPAL
jgi:hypothetical protein